MEASPVVKGEQLDMESLLAHLPAGVLALDGEGRVRLITRCAAAILQLEPESALGRSLTSLIAYPGIAFREIDELYHRIRSGEMEATATLVLRNYEGALRSYHLHGCLAPVAGDPSGVLLMLHDQAPGESPSDGRVAAHTTARLAAALAHEIRNPLSSIKGAAQYLLRHRAADATLREFLDIILEEVDAMNRVTTDFLEFSQRGLPTASYVNRVDVVLQRTLRLLEPNFADRGIRVIQEIDPNISEVLMQSTQLEQVLRNIFLNAIDAMPEGGTLTVVARQDLSRRQPEVALSIRDTGRGIPQDQLQRVFERSFTTKRQGAGLGLAIVREVVDNHGGRVMVESRPGKGTMFTLILPATQAFARGGTEAGA